jgi:hypothetical protein
MPSFLSSQANAVVCVFTAAVVCVFTASVVCVLTAAVVCVFTNDFRNNNGGDVFFAAVVYFITNDLIKFYAGQFD